MSRSKQAAELCALLVNEIYGELTSRIFAALLRRGRLHLFQIVAHTRLTKRHIQHGLVVLIQQNLLYHFHDELDDRTYYEANIDAAYALVRTGKIAELVEDRYGEFAKGIAQNLLLLGHSSISGLEATYESTTTAHANGDSNHTNGVNGKSSSIPVGQLHATLAKLLQSGFVERVNERMFRSPTDTRNLVERGLLRDRFGGQIKGTKQKDELKIKVREQLKIWRDEGRDWQPAGSKRANGVNGHSKKRRLSGFTANGNHGFQDDGFRLDPTLVVRINYEKCTVALRSHRLVELANSRIGETTAVIYAEILRLLEENISRCRLDPAVDDYDDIPEPSVTTAELNLALSKTIRLSEGIGDPNHTATRKPEKPTNEKNAHPDNLEAEGDAGSDEDVEMNGNGDVHDVEEHFTGDNDPFDEEIRPAKRTKVTFQEKLPKPKQQPAVIDSREERLHYLKMHLQLLAQDSCQFIRKCGQGGSSEWTVDFERLIEQLREIEVDTILLENFGQGGLRLVRMLRKLGKLEEKAIPNLALMKQKDIRTKMAEMQMAGMVDIQEVPRDSGRTIARTIFLWYFDPERVHSILLSNVYKSMSRCLQRLEHERREASGILAVIERTDVREAGEQGLLNEVLDAAQQKMLKEIRAKEDVLLGQMARLDELVGIFRDY